MGSAGGWLGRRGHCAGARGAGRWQPSGGHPAQVCRHRSGCTCRSCSMSAMAKHVLSLVTLCPIDVASCTHAPCTDLQTRVLLTELICHRYDFFLASALLGGTQYETEFDFGGTHVYVSTCVVEGLRCFFIEPQNGFFAVDSVYGRRDDGMRFEFFCKVRAMLGLPGSPSQPIKPLLFACCTCSISSFHTADQAARQRCKIAAAWHISAVCKRSMLVLSTHS